MKTCMENGRSSERAGFKMDQLTRILVDRLLGKGIVPCSIPAYVRDLFNTISTYTNLALNDVNRGMARLGWDEFELDDHTLQLITAVFGTVAEYEKVGEDLYELKRVHARQSLGDKEPREPKKRRAL
jgi:hypothetical protein